MHVNNDWYRFYVDPNRKRTNSLCNTKTSATNAGVPGIDKPNKGKWCARCIHTLRTCYLDSAGEVDEGTPYEIVYLTHVVATETYRLSGKKYAGPNYLPLWHRANRSYNNPYFAAWSVLLDRCYNPAHPEHDAWKMFDVHERWLEFENFVEDVKDEGPPSAVLPKPGAGVTIGPDNYIIMSHPRH